MSDHKLCPRCQRVSIEKEESMCLSCRYPPAKDVDRTDVRPRCKGCDRVLTRHQDIFCSDCGL